MKPDQPFGSLWENYIFKIATLVIDSVSADDQRKLIHLIHQANPSSPAETVLGGDEQQKLGNLPGSPLAQLARQWGAALRQPLTPRRIRLEGDQVLLRRALLLTQQQIESTQLCITQLNELIEQAKNTTSSRSRQNQLLLHYQGIQGKHTAYLVKLKLAQDKQIGKLKR
ncbi:hypothetical protein [Spirosoma koreense]